MMKKLLAAMLIAALALTAAAVAEAPAITEEVKDRFSDTWATEGYSVEIWIDEGDSGFSCDCVLKDNSFLEFRNCAYDPAADALICKGGEHFNATYNEQTTDYDREILDEGVTATIAVKNDLLTCEDSLNQLSGRVFLRLSASEDVLAAAQATRTFTQADMDRAVALITAQFSDFGTGRLETITYAGDEANNAENLKWLSELKDKPYTACLKFLTDFHTPAEGTAVLEPDTEYKDYEWYLAREDGGDWELVSWGYC